MQIFDVETCEGVLIYSTTIDLHGEDAKKRLLEIHKSIYGEHGDMKISKFIHKKKKVIAIIADDPTI